MNLTTIAAMENLSAVVDNWLSDLTTKESSPLAVDDPIAAACASYRYGKETGHRWSDLSSAKITKEDRVKAQEIRRYYTGRLTVQALQGRPLTEFRKKLYSILNNEYVVTEGDQGLLQRLPYFYEEDTGMEEIVANTVSAKNTPYVPEQFVTLTPYKKIFYGRKRGEFMQFWWRDPQQHGVVLSIKTDNQLFSLVDGLFDRPREFETKFGISAHHWYNKDHHYYKLIQPKLA